MNRSGDKIAPAFDLHVVLHEPEIPQNTGTIARLCVATGTTLHLAGPLGFRLTDVKLKRAGLDYFQHADIRRHLDLASCLATLPERPVYFFSAHATQLHTAPRYGPGSVFVFGSETKGLPKRVLQDAGRCYTIPILDKRVRSLNLAVSAGIVLYEAIRQIGDCES